MIRASLVRFCVNAALLSLAVPVFAQVPLASLDGAEFVDHIILGDGSNMGGRSFVIKGQRGIYTGWGYRGRDKETRRCTFVGLTCVLRQTAVMTEFVEIRPDGGQAFYKTTFQFEPQANAQWTMRRVR